MLTTLYGTLLQWGCRGGGWNHFLNGRGYFPGGMIMGFVGLVLIGLLVFLVLKGYGVLGRKTDSPEEQLKRRFVNGEISKEDYLEKKEFLKKN